MRQAIIKQKKKVFVGLSGGVDSSVSAALLKKQGFDVTGVFIKTWTPDWLECTWKEERLDAMRICAKLDIPFFTLDLEKEYKRDVVDYMIAEYKVGRTPNPDVMCNKYIKFGGFFDWAIKQGADYVATGHYARVRSVKSKKSKVKSKTKNSDNFTLSTLHFQLLAGTDKNKDQSYFLWTLTQKQLSKTLFPIGHLEKVEVRKLAKKFGLFTAEKKDSQGLCFMGKVNVKDFLAHYIKPKRGRVLLVPSGVEGNDLPRATYLEQSRWESRGKGEKIGYHDGAVFLTIGERHGFHITRINADTRTRINADDKSAKISIRNQRPFADMEPYYVVAKDVKKNTITVANKLPSGVLPTSKEEVKITNINFLGLRMSDVLRFEDIRHPQLFARVRYRQPLQRVRIMNKVLSKDGELKIKFEEPQIATSGQSLVLYKGDECLGGGIITN